MTNSLFNVTRFSFVGGRAKPVEQTLSLEGLNKYGSKHITFSANVEGKEKPAHLFNLDIVNAQALVDLMKVAIAEAKSAADTTPAEYVARMKAKEAKLASLAPTVAPTDISSLVAMLQSAGFKIEAPTPTTVPTVTPKTVSKALKRGTTHTKPAEALKPAQIPTVDDLESISTTDLEAVQSIMSILLGKRGTK